MKSKQTKKQQATIWEPLRQAVLPQQPLNNGSKGNRFTRFWRALGPGLITGAADDDPSGIFTYSQAGAQFGLGQLWLAVFMLPFLISIQEVAARIGVVTRKGITQVMRENYSEYLVVFIVSLLVIANTINLGADLGAMAAVTKLFFNGSFMLFAVFFFAIILYLEIQVPYVRYAKFLKWLTFSLFAYIFTGLIAGGNWHAILQATFFPHLEFNFAFFLIITGVLGTTISPYLFYWQASQEVEERKSEVLENHRMPNLSKQIIANMRVDNFVGMVFSEITTWFIIVTTATVLHEKGVTNITNAAQAAAALQPLVQTFPHSGLIAEILFALGIVGTGLLAIPIFAATSSYAIAEIFKWREGLEYKFQEAKAFYAVIIAGSLIGLLINMLGVNPIKFLIYTAVINGIVSVPVIFILIRIANTKKIMGKYTSGRLSNSLAGITFLGMALAAIGTILTLFYH